MDNSKCEPCAVDTLSIFDPIPVQSVMTGHQIIRILPSTSDLKYATTIEFDFPTVETATYYDLSDTKLVLNIKTLTDANANPAIGTIVTGSFVNLITSSLFSDVRLVIFDKPVEATGNMYAYQSMIHTLLRYSKSQKKEKLLVAGYFDEDPTKDTEYVDLPANLGYLKKREVIKNKCEKFIGTINLGLFRQALKLPGFVKMKLVFTRAPIDFYIDNMTNDKPAKLKIEVTNMYIETRQVHVVSSVLSAHIQAWKQRNFLYHINRELTVHRTMSTGSSGDTLASIFPTSQIPKLLVMTMVRSEAFNGHGQYDPYNFRHFDLKSAKLIINSIPTPYPNAFEPSWEDCGYMKEYYTLNSIGSESNLCGITPFAYANGRFFLVWNLCPDKNLDGAAEIIKSGTVTLELSFGKPLPYAIHVIFYGVFDNTIEITHDKEVVRNWV